MCSVTVTARWRELILDMVPNARCRLLLSVDLGEPSGDMGYHTL
jgi:hypothetical protein